MLAIQTYRFWVRSKIPFSEWPQIAQTFLAQQSLHYDRFLYYFEDDWGACPKAVKNCPNLGPIREGGGIRQKTPYLSNIEDGIGCSEAEIMALMPKIHRRYGFGESYIIFQDIDFFSQNIPAIIQSPGNIPSCVKGSSIVCFRDSVFPNLSCIDLRIIINDGHNIFDPTPYLEAMKQFLPGIKYEGFVECCMTEDEQHNYNILNQNAIPILEEIRNYFATTLPDAPQEPRYSENNVKLTLAPTIKKLCKQYGYTYVQYTSCIFFVQKRTPNGHYIVIYIDPGPYHHEISFWVDFSGVGFKHRIAESSFFQANGGDVNCFLAKCFEVLSAAEKDVLPALDTHFPSTPDWFVPLM